MSIRGQIHVRGADLTGDDARRLRALASDWSLHPGDPAVRLAPGPDQARLLILSSDLGYAAHSSSHLDWPLVADEIAVVQAAFPGRPVYYGPDGVPLDVLTRTSCLVDDAYLADSLIAWQRPAVALSGVHDDPCGHDQLEFSTNGSTPRFAVPGLTRPSWWYATSAVECVSCWAWVWQNATCDDDLTVPDAALTGLPARTAMTLLLRGECATLREAFTVAEAVAL